MDLKCRGFDSSNPQGIGADKSAPYGNKIMKKKKNRIRNKRIQRDMRYKRRDTRI
jgi:hypothetical protein